MTWPPKQPTAWPADLLAVVGIVPRLTAQDLPPFPFLLQPHVTITGPAWLDSIKIEVAEGPKGARFRSGALQADLRWLLYRVALHRGNGPRPKPPRDTMRPPKARASSKDVSKAQLLARLTLKMREHKVSRRDVNGTLKRVRSTTLSSATKEDLLWLLETLNR